MLIQNWNNLLKSKILYPYLIYIPYLSYRISLIWLVQKNPSKFAHNKHDNFLAKKKKRIRRKKNLICRVAHYIIYNKINYHTEHNNKIK